MGVSYAAAAVLCSLVGLLLYLNTLDCGLCFDDERTIIKNMDLRPPSPWSNLLWNDFWGVPIVSRHSHKSYRPLCVATFRLNYLLHELQPMGYHLVNVLLHGAVCYLYVQLCGVIFSEVWPALIAGLLFAVHPIHTEAVTGVVGRADVLAGLFYLASILAYRRAVMVTKRPGGCRYQWVAVCLLLVTCSALSKEVGITAAAVCLVYDIIFIQQLSVWSVIKLLSGRHKVPCRARSYLKRVLVMCVYVAVFLVVRIHLMKHQPVLEISLNPARGLPSPYRQLHWSYLSAFNTWLLFSPSKLSPEYAMGTVPLITSLTDLRNVATVVTFGVMLSLAVFGTQALKERNRVVLLGLAMIVLPFIPASNLFFPVGFVVAERVLYLPSMGFCLLVGYGVNHISKNVRGLRYLSVFGLLYLLAVQATKTIHRNRDWYSEQTLYHAAVQTFPDNGKMLHNLATLYANTGDLHLAEVFMRASTEAEPEYANSHSDLGLILRKQERLEEAEQQYRKAVELVYKGLEVDGSVAAKGLKVFSRLAKIVKMDPGRLQEAYDIVSDIMRRFPGVPYSSNLYSEMGDILMRMGKYSPAKTALETAIKLQPNYMEAYIHLSKVHLELGNVSLAERCLRDGLAVCGPHTDLLSGLAHLLHSSHHGNRDRLLEAKQLLGFVLSASPNNTEVLHELGLVLYDLGKYRDAESAFLRALRISPRHSGALYDLARVYVATGHYSSALSRLEALMEAEPRHRKGQRLMELCHHHGN